MGLKKQKRELKTPITLDGVQKKTITDRIAPMPSHMKANHPTWLGFDKNLEQVTPLKHHSVMINGLVLMMFYGFNFLGLR